MWSTVAVECLGIPKVHVTDGPNGARGSSFPGAGGPPSTCIPCGTAIGATWNAPPKDLKAFAKVWLETDERTTVDPVLEGRAFAHWDPGQDDWDAVQELLPEMFNLLSPPVFRRERGWQVDAGRYDLLIGRSSQDVRVVCSVVIPDDTSWR